MWREDQHRELRKNALRQLGLAQTHVWHARTTLRAWRYLTKAGEVREWLQHQLAHAHNFERVSMISACSEFLGKPPLPAIDGATVNHLTQSLLRVTCMDCRVALDRLLGVGRLKVDERARPGFFEVTR